MVPLPAPGVAATVSATRAAADAVVHLCCHAPSHTRKDSADDVLRGVSIKNATARVHWAAAAGVV